MGALRSQERKGTSMNEKKTVWVTGAAGFVGGEIARRIADYGYNVVGTDTEVSVCDDEGLQAFANELHPDIVINAAGIPRFATGLSNRIKAYEVNALGAKNVAVAANQVGAFLVQISTDDVFPPRMAEAANEFDSPHPETPYGKSKRAGEVMVRDIMPDRSLIVRSSWLYGTTGGMVKHSLDAAKAGDKVKMRTDQISSPTSISTYVSFLEKAIAKEASGTLHIVGSGTCSRYEFASKVLELCGYDPQAVLVPSADLVTAEQVLLESLMLEMFGAELPAWEKDLESFLVAEGLAK